jgi:hypothetical protein
MNDATTTHHMAIRPEFLSPWTCHARAVVFASTPLDLDGCAGGKHTHTHTRVTRPAENSARIYLCPRHAVKVRIWWHAR